MRSVVFGLACLLALTAPALAQRTIPCAPLEIALEILYEQYGEVIVRQDTGPDGVVWRIRTRNPQTGSYSVLLVSEKMACLLAEGTERVL